MAKKSTHTVLIFCTLLFAVPSKIVSLEVIRRLISAVGDADTYDVCRYHVRISCEESIQA